MSFIEEPEKNKLGSAMFPYKKQLAIFLCGWLGFQIIAASIQIFFMFGYIIAYPDNYTEMMKSASFSMLVNSLSYIALSVALFGIANVDIKKLLPSFKQYQSYLAGILCLISIFVFTYIYSTITSLIHVPVSDNTNEASIQSIDKLFPFTSLIVFGILGPVCEELTYRVGLFSFMKRKSTFMAYFVTIIIFALIHFNFTTNVNRLINELLNLPYYMFAAAAFSFTYDKFGFSASLTAHILNNVISLSLVAIIH